MPELNYLKQGRGPVVVLSHALGGDLHMWDEVAQALASRFTVLRYDHRGHGRSAAAGAGCTVQALAQDVAGLVGASTREAVHFVGMSLGGLVGQQLAVDHPELVRSIVLANTCHRYDETARGIWRARIETVRNLGMGAAAEGAMKRWFTPEFQGDARGAERVAQVRAVFESTDPGSYAAVCEAVMAADFGGTNPRIACPALVIGGQRDEATPPAMAHALANTISGAQLAMLDGPHMCAIEQPQAFADLVAAFVREA